MFNPQEKLKVSRILEKLVDSLHQQWDGFYDESVVHQAYLILDAIDVNSMIIDEDRPLMQSFVELPYEEQHNFLIKILRR